jgi:uncharacterized protein (TIGR03435 family)
MFCRTPQIYTPFLAFLAACLHAQSVIPMRAGLPSYAEGEVYAQSPDHPSTFEVVSIKLVQNGSSPVPRIMGGPGTRSPGQFTCSGVTLRQLVLRAYNLEEYQVVAPGGIDRNRFDVVAKVPPGTTKDGVGSMIQDLLARRFGLIAHWESREMAIYETAVAKGGLKLKESRPPANDGPGEAPEDPGDEPVQKIKRSMDKSGLPELMPGVKGLVAMPANGHMRISARMQPIANLFSMLNYQIDRPVVDKIGLTGTYDFNLDYSPSLSSDAAPPLFIALERQLGLKLVPKKAPVQVFVIDKLSDLPTEN